MAILDWVATIHADRDTDRLGAEYRALTETCGLLDRSERGKLALTGADAREFLNGQVTNDILALRPGEGCYAAFLTPKGKMLGDLRVLDRGEELWLDTERVALQALFDMIRRFKIGYDVQLHKRTLERGLLSLIGPDAALIAGVEGLPEAEHTHMPVRFDGGTTNAGDTANLSGMTGPGQTPDHGKATDSIEAIAVRTDTGVDLICASADISRLTDVLLARGALPVSEDAAEIIRVEHGRPRYGIDLDDTVIPQEAGLNERAVSFTKGCYVGQETVARLYYKGHPNRHLRGLRLSAPVPADMELDLGKRAVGRLTSSVVSPAHGPIGLALVRREAEPRMSVHLREAGESGRRGEEGAGQEGTGEEGAGNEGTGQEGAGEEGTGREGAGGEGLSAEIVELPFIGVATQSGAPGPDRGAA